MNKELLSWLKCKQEIHEKQRKTRNTVGPLLEGAEAPVTENAEKSELLNALLVLVTDTGKTSQVSLTVETMVKEC